MEVRVKGISLCSPFPQGLPIDMVGPEQDSTSHRSDNEELEEEDEGTQDTVTGRQPQWVWGKPSVTFLCRCLIPMLCFSPAMTTNGAATFLSRTLNTEGGGQGVSQNWGAGAELALVGYSPCASACVCRTQRSVRTPRCGQCLPWNALQIPACWRAMSRRS